MAASPVENVDKVLSLRKELDTIQSSKTKDSLKIAMYCLETGYHVQPDYESVVNTDPNTLALNVMSIEVNEIKKPKKKDGVPIVYPPDPEDFNWEGNALRDKGLFAEAVQQYTKAIELNSKRPTYYYNRAAANCHLRNYEMCVDDCFCAIKLDPTYGQAWGCLGMAYYEQGELFKAREAFLKGIAFMPKMSSCYKIYLDKVDRRLSNIYEDPEPGPSGSQAVQNALNSDEDYEHLEALTEQLVKFLFDDDSD